MMWSQVAKGVRAALVAPPAGAPPARIQGRSATALRAGAITAAFATAATSASIAAASTAGDAQDVGLHFERLADGACSHCFQHNRDRLWGLTNVPTAHQCAAVCAGRLADSEYGRCAFFSHSRSLHRCHLCKSCANHSFVVASHHNRTRAPFARRGIESWRRHWASSSRLEQ